MRVRDFMPIPIRGEGVTDRATVDRPSRTLSPTHTTELSEARTFSAESIRANCGVLLVGHGSRRTRSNYEFESLVRAFAERFPQLPTSLCYVELAQPSLAAAIAKLAREVEHVVLLPTFLFLAGHVKNDLPLAVARAREEFPKVSFLIAAPLGVNHRLCELAWMRAESALGTSLPSDRPSERERTACLLVGRGSNDPDANAEFFKAARLMSESRQLIRVEPCFIGITHPDVNAGLELLARLRPKRIVIVPYLLFAGRLLEGLQSLVEVFRTRYPWLEITIAPHLGADAIVLNLLAQRVMNAIAGTGNLPCDTCQYREPLPGRVLQAGGLRALLWSMRHTFTHSQAMPAEHAHPRVEKHVFVCTNVDCANRGAVALLRELRTEIKSQNLTKHLRVTRTACMGRCGEGPSVAVYPDGIWYRNVSAQDASELVEEHLKGDRLVARLVDNILQ